jgi:cell division protein FtsL
MFPFLIKKKIYYLSFFKMDKKIIIGIVVVIVILIVIFISYIFFSSDVECGICSIEEQIINECGNIFGC